MFDKQYLKLGTVALLLFVALVAGGCGTPLHRAAESGNLSEAERLIKEGADVNAKNELGETPLYFAAQSDNKNIAEILISKGADVNAKSNYGWTPLHGVNKKEVAEFLISKGADVNAKDISGFTPLHWAATHKKKEVAEFLISKGADLNAKSNGGATPLDFAVSNSSHAVATFLKDVMSGKVRVAVSAPPEDPREVAAFEAEANKYRALAVKPALPEEARKYNVRAMTAFKDKQFEEAAGFYADALKVAPWLPDAHFNRALILGELNRFAEAIREMKRYLLLVPDAPNARAAQDKIYEWERFTSK